MDRNPVLQDLHAFHNPTSNPVGYQTKMTIPDTPDNQRNNMMFNHTSDTQSNIATSFLDELDFSFYPPNNIMAQSIPPSMPIQQPQGMYSPNMFYPQQQQQQQFLLQQQPQQPQQQQQQQQQHYLPVFSSPQLVQHNQILLQRYNSNGSTTSSTNSQPSFLSNNYHSMGHFNVPMHAQQQGVYYQQQLQAELKKRQGTMNYGELLVEDHLLHQQAAGGSIMKKKPKTKKKKKVVDPNAPPKPKRKTGLNKPLILSPALSELMDGDKELSRPELVQKLWKYIKGNDLQDPADRRFILCDAKLKKIFDQDRINSFGMNKDLSAHLTKKEEEPAKELEETAEISHNPEASTPHQESASTPHQEIATPYQEPASTSAKEPTSEEPEDFLLNL